MDTTKICKKCGIEREITRFAYRSDLGTRRGVCIPCKNEQQNLVQLRRRHNNKEFQLDESKRKPWNDPDKLYISKQIKKFVAETPIYRYCAWCRMELKSLDSGIYLMGLGYCSEWCREIDNPLVETKTRKKKNEITSD